MKMGSLSQVRRALTKRWIFRTSSDHTEAFRRWTEWRRQHDGSDAAIGGSDSNTEIGKLQFEFLKSRGLSQSDRLLDLGCGTLRGGQYFIDFLDPDRYVGMDINENLIEEGKEKIETKTCERKMPRFIVNTDLTFSELDGEVFDYILAQSVFTHLPRSQIVECFENVHNIMNTESELYATIFTEQDHGGLKSGLNNYTYDTEQFMDMAEKNGLSANMLSVEEYIHPRRQRMVVLQPN